MNSKEAAGQTKGVVRVVLVMGKELDMEASSGRDVAGWEIQSGGEVRGSGMRDRRCCGRMSRKCFGG